jgi:hypothetical protein
VAPYPQTPWPTTTVAGGSAGLDLASQMAYWLAQLGLQRELGMPNITGFFEEYETIHGPKSLDEMRQELAIASEGSLDTAGMTATQIVQEYGKVTGQPVKTLRKPTMAYQQFLASKSGPIDYQMYQALNGKPGFGSMTGTPSWEAFAANQLGNDAWSPPTGTTQPIQMRPQEWLNLGQSGQEMYSSNLRALGVDDRDALQYMQNAWPKGQANPWSAWNS